MKNKSFLIVLNTMLLILTSRVFAQTQLGSDIDGEAASDYSGSKVSLNSDGDRVAIGAHGNDDGPGDDAGHVRVYEYSSSSWSQLGSDIDGEAAGDYSGSSVSMDSDGDRVAIGAYFNDGTASTAGHVRVYEYSSSSWSQLGSDIDGEAAYDRSGRSVSINSAGDRVAIGGYLNDGTGSNAGHVRVYEYSSSSWSQLGSDIDGEAAGDFSGFSVSMNSAGDRVAIGAYNNDGTGSNAGHVRVYEYSSGSWSKLGSDIDGEAAGDRSGYSVSMDSDGDRVAIGAYLNDGTGTDAGHVRVYEWNGSSWNKLGSDIDGEAPADQSGASVSINSDGDRVAIGANFNDGTASAAGHVRVYEYSSSSWSQLGSDIDGEAASDQSGASVSINSDGDRVAIGANGNDGTGSYAGHVRVIEIGSVTISGTSGFRMMSSPVAGQVYSDLLSELWTQGMTGAADVTSGDANVWTYSTAGQSWSALTNISTASQTAGAGFLVYVYQDANFDGDTSDDADLPVTLSVSGTENSSSATVGSIGDGNWALIGNPFYSTIDWDLVTQTNVTTSAYVWDSQAGTPAYVSWNSSSGSLTNGLIAPFQGFWVRASGGTGSITIATADKASPNASNFYKTMQDNTGSVSFSVTSGDYEDRTFVSFMTNGDPGIDNSDAYKLLPLMASERIVAISYAEINGLDINNLPYESDNAISFPLDVMYLTVNDNSEFVTQEETVTMTWDLNELPAHITITLTDNTTNSTIDLTQQSELSFTTAAKGSFPSSGNEAVPVYPQIGNSHFTVTISYNEMGTDNEELLPIQYALHQNYPNPFNPTTTLRYDLPETGLVSINIYDMLGRQVKTLINQTQDAGYRSVFWDATNDYGKPVSAGIYLYQIQAGGYMQTKKMVLLK
jgi:hypothetical protein